MVQARDKMGGPLGAALRAFAPLAGLAGVVHIELDRVRSHLEPQHLAHLELDVAIDKIVIEHATSLEEGTVLIEARESFAQRAAYGRNLLHLLRRQIVEVLIHRLARI